MHLLDGVCRRVRPWLAAMALLVTSAALIPSPVLAQDQAAAPAVTEAMASRIIGHVITAGGSCG